MTSAHGDAPGWLRLGRSTLLARWGFLFRLQHARLRGGGREHNMISRKLGIIELQQGAQGRTRTIVVFFVCGAAWFVFGMCVHWIRVLS